MKAAWEKQEIEKKWANSAFAKSRVNRDKRRQLTDFERYKVLRLKKQVSKKSWFWKGFWNFWICRNTTTPAYLTGFQLHTQAVLVNFVANIFYTGFARVQEGVGKG